MRISIDFDSCLSQPKVQELAKQLITQGHDVFILTSRFDSVRRLKFPDLASNEDLYQIAEEVGIKPHRIAFTNQQKKWIWLLEYHSDTLAKQINIHISVDILTIQQDLAVDSAALDQIVHPV